ncbi:MULTISPECIES: FAS1-like dehydratase domain-containing protein [Pseudomonas]|uniref:FAS1-like dehydratase domain-containing protein n=1 Tax=Pseudomonas TaxID=286 RepID=UPI00093F750B|nr:MULTISPECIES: MaoC family dehydratase N-terminal domain-containing protein [Pseudomonas]MDH0639620.1 MaoC family dehydratase N-terminal domain-containing protein [Pseudomonas sp. GD03860]
MSGTGFIGYQHPPFEVRVTRESLDRFNQAIGVAGAGADSPAPPTYMKVIEGEGGSSRAILIALDIKLHRVLHAEQSFEYHAPIHAGDVLEVHRSISDHYTRKNGTREFLVIESRILRADKTLVGCSRQILILRNI